MGIRCFLSRRRQCRQSLSGKSFAALNTCPAINSNRRRGDGGGGWVLQGENLRFRYIVIRHAVESTFKGFHPHPRMLFQERYWRVTWLAPSVALEMIYKLCGGGRRLRGWVDDGRKQHGMILVRHSVWDGAAAVGALFSALSTLQRRGKKCPEEKFARPASGAAAEEQEEANSTTI